jgi:hypothetical protein
MFLVQLCRHPAIANLGSKHSIPQQNAPLLLVKVERKDDDDFDCNAPMGRQVSIQSSQAPLSPMARHSPMARQLSSQYHKGSLATFYDEPQDTDVPAGGVMTPGFQASTANISFHMDDDPEGDINTDAGSVADAGAVQVTQELSDDSDLDRPMPLGRKFSRQLSELAPKSVWGGEGGEEWNPKIVAIKRQVTDPPPRLKKSMAGHHVHNSSLSTFYD